MKTPTVQPEAAYARELDIVEMPLEGLAAYWLSLKKLMDAKRGREFLAEEARHTGEPYVRHLLESAYAGFPDELLTRLAQAKQAALLEAWGRALSCMSAALRGMASSENPHMTLLRLLARYPTPPLAEKKAAQLAQAVLKGVAEPDADRTTLLSVDHAMAADRLVVKLLFYCMFARREGMPALGALAKHVRCRVFAEGLALLADGIDPTFVLRQCDRRIRAMLDEAGRKMHMSLEMLLAIRAGKLAYEEIYLIARAFMA